MAASVTHGVAVGEVTASSAVIWSRSSEPAEMIVELGADATLSSPRILRANATADEDFTARVAADGLEPSTTYHYRVRFDASEPVAGSFQTAPAPTDAEPVRFVVMGDLGGHGYCREEGVGYAVFAEMEKLEPHFLIANGDMIYADSECLVERAEGGRNVPGDFPRIDDPRVDWTDAAAVREVYLAHWRYNRADPHFQSLLSTTSMYSQWDDHEVINDFGAEWPTLTAAIEREGYPTLVREGRRALFEFHPMRRHPEEPDRIYTLPDRDDPGFDEAAAWCRVADPQALAAFFRHALEGSTEVAAIGARGRELVGANRGATDRTLALLQPWLAEAMA